MMETLNIKRPAKTVKAHFPRRQIRYFFFLQFVRYHVLAETPEPLRGDFARIDQERFHNRK